MCFVLDANAFCCFFDEKNQGHANFIPLFNWLYDRNHSTSLVIGGTLYRQEIGKLVNYFGYLTELSKVGKISNIDNSVVDVETRRISKNIKDKKFNDAHIVALICASGCRILASKDRKADEFIKDKKFYLKDKGQEPPLIYRYKDHKKMLTKENIVKKLRNLEKSRKK